MVEFQMAKRVGSKIERYAYRLNQGIELNILPYIYPKIAALVPTFDCEGKYGGGSTTEGESIIIPKLLAVFNELNFRGTFNFVGKTANEHAEIVKKIHSFGNDIWGHGFSHKYLDNNNEWTDEEISNTTAIISKLIGESCAGWRSPYGTFNERLYQLLIEKGIIYGSNWGNSTWGNMPFFPIVNGKKINICELPFDDVHFDAMIFRKIGLSHTNALNLYKSKLLASMNNLSIFTPLIHPVNLAEDINRFNMYIDFLRYSSQFAHLWVTSCSSLLKNHQRLSSIKANELYIKNKQHNTTVDLKLTNNETAKSDVPPITLSFRISGNNQKIESNSQYSKINFTPHETILCFPIDLSLRQMELNFEVIKR